MAGRIVARGAWAEGATFRAHNKYEVQALIAQHCQPGLLVRAGGTWAEFAGRLHTGAWVGRTVLSPVAVYFPVGHWWDTEPQKSGDDENKREQISR
jgi:hypothetical protein